MHTPQRSAADIDAAAFISSRPLPSADVITTLTDLHERLVRSLYECGLTLACLVEQRDALDVAALEALTTTRGVLDRAIRDIQTTAMAVRQELSGRTDIGDKPQSDSRRSEGGRPARTRASDLDHATATSCWLCLAADNQPFAYARGDGFYRRSDRRLWAHLREGALISARTGRPLALQAGNDFIDPDTGNRVYYVAKWVTAS